MIFEFPILNEEDLTLPIYIEELGYLENQDHVIRDEDYTNNQILICTGGTGKLLVEGKVYTITERSVFLTKKHIPHEYYALTEPWTIHWIVFDGTYIDQLFHMLNINKGHEVFDMPTTKHISDVFEASLAMVQSVNPKKHLECSIKIYGLITQLSYCRSVSTPNQSITKKQQTYGKLLRYIEDHYSEDISLDHLGATFGLSPYYISRLFKNQAQMGLINYLNQYRLSMAKKMLLQHPDVTIKFVSLQTGFKSSSYFCAMFKKSEGISPVAFRKLHGLV